MSFAGVSKAIKALKNQQPMKLKGNTEISKIMADKQAFEKKLAFSQRVLNGYN